nr:zinc finger, CCHC-type [Tanacetum cinerariifolium]
GVGGSYYKWYQELWFTSSGQQEGAAGLTIKGYLKIVFSPCFTTENSLNVLGFLSGRVIATALEVLLTDMEAQAKAELNKKAYSAMILCLGNKVLREE